MSSIIYVCQLNQIAQQSAIERSKTSDRQVTTSLSRSPIHPQVVAVLVMLLQRGTPTNKPNAKLRPDTYVTSDAPVEVTCQYLKSVQAVGIVDLDAVNKLATL